MNTMFGFLDRIQVQKEPGPEQYLGEDGLIYCGKCHTPVQFRITFEGRERIMPCICKCQKEERERQEQRMKEEEQLLYVRRLKAGRYPGPTLRIGTICISDGYSQRPDGETVYGELEEGSRQKTLVFYFGAMLEQENHSWLPVLLMHCWKKVFLS